MKTLRLAVDPKHLDKSEEVGRAAQILRSGGLVALPTETVYGLGANALDRSAVERVFEAKGRPAWDPVIVHIADATMLQVLIGEVAGPARDRVEKLVANFWPGPLTLLLPRSRAVPDVVTAGRPLVGIRMPAHPVARELIRRAGVPVAAPSANLFGHISPTTADHVLADLVGRIDAVLDAGPTEHGVESTVVDPCRSPIVIYRPGAVTAEQIRATAGAAELFRAEENLSNEPREALPSPGVGVRHYAPKAKLVLVEGTLEELGERMAETAQGLAGERVGVMLPEGIGAGNRFGCECRIFQWGKWTAPEEMARQLYAGLRALDAENCTVILCPVPPEGGIGEALRDRLRKAAAR